MPAPDTLRREAGTVARFGLAGLANTAFGLAVILGLELGLGVGRHLANVAGYLAGAVLSLILYRRFVFTGPVAEQGLRTRYAVAWTAAFAANQGVLALMARLLPEGDLPRTLAQLSALATFTAAQFLLMRLWVFRTRA